ncbi:MAG: ADP-ribosylglycohydrolase family protein [Chloroflexota bacterium]
MVNDDHLRSVFRGSLLGGAIGDVLGAPFEGWPIVTGDALARAMAQIDRLQYTDDTHMTIGMAESLVACGGFDGDHMARMFAEHFKAEPWRGYGSGPPAVFRMLEIGIPWDQAASQLFGGDGSYGNGAAMRVAPAALLSYSDPERLRDIVSRTAIITHSHELGVEGAVIQARAIASLVAHTLGEPLNVSEFLDDLRSATLIMAYEQQIDRVEHLLHEREPGRVAREIGTGITALEAVPAALFAFLFARDSFSDVIATAIALGGDTDTIAAMAGNLAGAYLGEEAIPEEWRTGVEGAALLRQLADRLLDLAGAAS